ncbi:MAG: nitroreductase [Clostridiales bacterium]|nr:nitroreductase [Clostridiales bacterium]
MNDKFYEMIFKRKSFHIFRDLGDETISNDEINEIMNAYEEFNSLNPEIKTAIRIVPSGKTSCKRGEEYCILMFSEKKDGYLQNIGYLGEQLDLFLVFRNIGTLWFGIGKTDEKPFDGMEFVIMIAIRKISDEKKYRKDMFKSKRKPINEIWEGEQIPGVTDIVRFAPSACNSQPWFVKNIDGKLYVYRYKKEGKRGIMPADKVSFYNRIDIGIFLCFLEICFEHNNIGYEKKLYSDDGIYNALTLNAEYDLRSTVLLH